MINSVALHRVQNLDKAMVSFYAKEELKNDVSAYLELRQLQLDAVEDEELALASSIGKSMRGIREKHDKDKWLKEINKQDGQ